jgi:transposase
METQLLNRRVYPSDISREQFESVRERLKNFKKRTKPRTVDLYDVFCGVLYVLKSGCQWRMLPSDFPKWRTVYEYNSKWRKQKNEDPSLLEQLLKKNWRDTSQIWTRRTDQFLYCGFTEREEYRHSRRKRI